MSSSASFSRTRDALRAPSDGYLYDLSSTLTLSSGRVGLGTGAAVPAAGALLELSSTTGGLLLSRLTTTQATALGVAGVSNGTLIYNSTTNKVQVRSSGAWVDLH